MLVRLHLVLLDAGPGPAPVLTGRPLAAELLGVFVLLELSVFVNRQVLSQMFGRLKRLTTGGPNALELPQRSVNVGVRLEIVRQFGGEVTAGPFAAQHLLAVLPIPVSDQRCLVLELLFAADFVALESDDIDVVNGRLVNLEVVLVLIPFATALDTALVGSVLGMTGELMVGQNVFGICPERTAEDIANEGSLAFAMDFLHVKSELSLTGEGLSTAGNRALVRSSLVGVIHVKLETRSRLVDLRAAVHPTLVPNSCRPSNGSRLNPGQTSNKINWNKPL